MKFSICGAFPAVTLRLRGVMANSVPAQEQGLSASASEHYPPDRRQLENERTARGSGRRSRSWRALLTGGEAAALHGGHLPAGDAARRHEPDRGAGRHRARRTGLPPGSRRAPIPAISARRCWPMPVRSWSSSAIRSAAPTMARPTNWCAHKALAALAAGLVPIICVGETRAEREAGQAGRGGRRGSWPARCPTRRRRTTSSSPTSRSGRSAPA